MQWKCHDSCGKRRAVSCKRWIVSNNWPICELPENAIELRFERIESLPLPGRNEVIDLHRRYGADGRGWIEPVKNAASGYVERYPPLPGTGYAVASGVTRKADERTFVRRLK